jgi:hypothetical protein
MEAAMIKMVKLVVSLGLFFGATLTLAAVQVRFIAPERFVDAGELGREREQMLTVIEQYLKSRGEKLLPGRDLAIEVLDLDLAGDVWPVGPRSEMLRIARPVGRPMMALRYVLSQDGRELRQGEARLTDLGYLDHMKTRYVDTDPLRYEKWMIDQWFSTEFSADSAK